MLQPEQHIHDGSTTQGDRMHFGQRHGRSRPPGRPYRAPQSRAGDAVARESEPVIAAIDDDSLRPTYSGPPPSWPIVSTPH